jgi:glyoxylase-like metal-dependent hydrolase (beta-lactamase superfamily II)
MRRRVVCLEIVDPQSHQRWMIEATPDFPAQLHALDQIAPPSQGQSKPALDGILLTHGHIGHYTGLMHLGREVMGARNTRNYKLLALLLAFLVLEAIFFGTPGSTWVQEACLRAGLFLVLGMISVVGGRIIPAFIYAGFLQFEIRRRAAQLGLCIKHR